MRSVLLVFVLLLFTFLVACDEGSVVDPPPLVKGMLSGQVWHRIHPEQVLEGVEVSWGDASDVSDAEGRYELSALEAGVDSLRLRLGGFHGEAEWIEIDGDSLSQGFTLMPIDTIPPIPISTFTAETFEGAQILLTWEAPEDETRTSFVLWKSPGDPHYQVLPNDQREFLDIQVAPLRDYHYQLQCRDAYGNLSEAVELDAEVDTYPTFSEIQVLAGADFSQIPLGWTENMDPDFSRYKVYRSESSNADSLDLLVYEGATNSFTDMDLLPNDVFSYRVYSFDESGNVSTGTRSEIDAAAQIYLPDYEENSSLVAHPDGESCWVVGRSSGDIHHVNGAGEELGFLDPSIGPALWVFKAAGDEAVGVSVNSNPASISHVRVDPFEEIDGSMTTLSALSDVAWVDAETVLVSSVTAGPPIFVSLDGFELGDTLHLLDDTFLRGILAVDPVTQILYIADAPSGGRLRAVDIDADPVILQEVALPGSPVDIGLNGDGEIVISYIGPGRVERRLLADLEQIVASSDLLGSPDRIFLSSDKTQLWYSDFETHGIFGVDLETFETIGELESIGIGLDIQVTGSATRLFVGQTGDLVNILSLDRGND